MTPLKFRAWLPDAKAMIEVGLMEFFTDGSIHVNEEHPTPHIIIMQSTGLCDKNGKEIFEGDIVSGASGGSTGKYKVMYYDKTASYECYGLDNTRLDPLYQVSDCEVIGNIYENPDLLPS